MTKIVIENAPEEYIAPIQHMLAGIPGVKVTTSFVEEYQRSDSKLVTVPPLDHQQIAKDIVDDLTEEQIDRYKLDSRGIITYTFDNLLQLTFSSTVVVDPETDNGFDVRISDVEEEDLVGRSSRITYFMDFLPPSNQEDRDELVKCLRINWPEFNHQYTIHVNFIYHYCEQYTLPSIDADVMIRQPFIVDKTDIRRIALLVLDDILTNT